MGWLTPFKPDICGQIDVIAKSKPVRVILIAVLAGIIVLLFLWLEPFGARYGGRTVNQWLGSDLYIPMAVVNEAGMRAVPTLVKAVRNSHRASWISSSNLVPQILIEPHTKRGHKAESWLILMDLSGHDPLPRLEKVQDSNLIDLIKKNRKTRGMTDLY
jgi:hypothetical protein